MKLDANFDVVFMYWHSVAKLAVPLTPVCCSKINDFFFTTVGTMQNNIASSSSSKKSE